MSKPEKELYCKLGQAVYNVVGAFIVMAIPVIACEIAGYLTSLI